MLNDEYRSIVDAASPEVVLVLPALMRRLSYPSPAELAVFLDTPIDALEGLTPRLAIEAGLAVRVLVVARLEGE